MSQEHDTSGKNTLFLIRTNLFLPIQTKMFTSVVFFLTTEVNSVNLADVIVDVVLAVGLFQRHNEICSNTQCVKNLY